MTALVAATLSDPDRPRTRGTRWRARAAGQAPASMAGLLSTPAWHRADRVARGRIARAAALIALRPAIDREVRGGPLGALARAAGEPLFDAVCVLDMPPIGDAAPVAGCDPATSLPPDRAALDALGARILALADAGDAPAVRCAAHAVAVLTTGDGA